MNSRLSGALVTAALLAAALPASSRLDTLRREAFCRPAAMLAAAVLGERSAEFADSSGFAIPVRPLPILVVPECSAIRFFCIASALLVGLCVQCGRPRLIPAIIAVAYGLTLVANTARIVCGWQAQCIAARFLPARDLASVHMGVGAACFIVFLILAYSLIERSLSHGRTETVA